MSAPIAIKGSKDGLRLVLAEDAAWEEIVEALRGQLDRGTEFFHGAELTIDTGDRPLQEQELSAVLTLMQEHGLQPAALATGSREGRTAGRAVGIATRPTARAVAPQVSRDQSADNGLMTTRTLRSGQVIKHHGHVTLIGDVNPGAEIIATGSVVVWGRVRGTIHAGALGDTSAVVCALEMMPALLRIADMMARQPDEQPEPSARSPELARIDQDGIVVEPWDGLKRQHS